MTKLLFSSHTEFIDVSGVKNLNSRRWRARFWNSKYATD